MPPWWVPGNVTSRRPGTASATLRDQGRGTHEPEQRGGAGQGENVVRAALAEPFAKLTDQIRLEIGQHRSEGGGTLGGTLEPCLAGDPCAEFRGKIELVPSFAGLLGRKPKFASRPRTRRSSALSYQSIQTRPAAASSGRHGTASRVRNAASKSSTDKFWHSQHFRHRAADIHLKHVTRAAHADKAETFGLSQQGEAVFRWTIQDGQPSAFEKALTAEPA